MTTKWIRLDKLFLSGLFIAIAPFIILSFLNHPQNDDYVGAAWTKAMGFVNANVRWYNVWSARYFSTAVMSGVLNPLIAGSFFAYKFTAVITLLLLFAALRFFTKELLAPVAGPRDSMILALALLALYVYQMPAIAESLYWWTGSTCYQYAIIFLLSSCGYMVRLSRSGGGGGTATAAALVVLFIVLAAGTNEIAAVLQCEFIAIMLIANFMARKNKSGLWPLFLTVSLIVFAVVIFAPGTQLRSSYGKHDLWFAVRSSVTEGSRYFFYWLSNTPLVPLAVLFMFFLRGRMKPKKSGNSVLPFSIHPFIALGLYVATYFGMFFPSFYGAGTLEQHTVSIIYFFFLTGFFINTAVIIQHYGLLHMPGSSKIDTFLPRIAWICLLALMIIPNSALKTAYADIISGEAYRYNTEQNERYVAIEECKSFICDVQPLQHRPKTIFWFENAVDEKNDSAFFHQYKDNGYAAYFGKKRIRLGPTASENVLSSQ